MSNTDANPSPMSRLTAAFAKMLGASAPGESGAGDDPATPRPAPDGVTTRGVVEALLFVGRPGGEALTAEEIARTMRDVTPDEVDGAVDELNAVYARDGSPYAVLRSPSGYRMRLDEAYARVREENRQGGRPARLSSSALEVLSIVAYRQPITGREVDDTRGKRSGAALAQLVRRQLVARDAGETTADAAYRTTDRFLRLFDLATPQQLPRIAELDD